MSGQAADGGPKRLAEGDSPAARLLAAAAAETAVVPRGARERVWRAVSQPARSGSRPALPEPRW